MTEKDIKYNTLYMDVAERVSQMSYAARKKVGAILVKDGNILGYGFNGTPKGEDNCCERYEYTYDAKDVLDNEEWVFQLGTRRWVKTVTKDNVLHAEENLFFKCLQEGKSTIGASLYVTMAPCIRCAKLTYGAGIKNVLYKDIYRDSSGIEFLNSHNINTEKI